MNRFLFEHCRASGRSSRRRLDAEPDEVSGWESGRDRDDAAAENTKLETRVCVRGVIRREGVYLLTHYGTVYGLFDEQTAAYDCALKSDIYRLADYVGDYVEVTGAFVDVCKEVPVMNVTCLQLVRTKWMR